MSKLFDRVKEISSTTGTGALTLGGAVVGFRTFASVLTNGDEVNYCITQNGDWEVGLGTYSSGTLSRDTVFASSNANALVNFGLGTKQVFLTASAQDIERREILTMLDPDDTDGALIELDLFDISGDDASVWREVDAGDLLGVDDITKVVVNMGLEHEGDGSPAAGTAMYMGTYFRPKGSSQTTLVKVARGYFYTTIEKTGSFFINTKESELVIRCGTGANAGKFEWTGDANAVSGVSSRVYLHAVGYYKKG